MPAPTFRPYRLRFPRPSMRIGSASVLLGLCLSASLVVRSSFADEPASTDAKDAPTQAELEADTVKSLRGFATNIQFHQDGSVRLIRFSKPIASDEHLAKLTEFPNLEYLAAVTPAISDAGLACLDSLPKLDTLELSGTAITEATLTRIGKLQHLQFLYLNDTAVTDAGLEHLGAMPKLKVLSLQRTGITSSSLATLAGLPELESLLLNGTAVDDRGLAALAKFPKLKHLFLNGTQVKGEQLDVLAQSSTLELLNLTGTQLDASAAVASLESFAGRSLKTVVLQRSNLAPDSIAALQVALPKVAIHYSGLQPVTAPRKAADDERQPSESAAAATHKTAPSECEPDVRSKLTEDTSSPPPVDFEPDFQRHVIPLLGRLGCNGRACHGSFQGQGGFRLSMFGYDFDLDHENLTGGDDPRVDRSAPLDSLILNKPTSEDEHGGGLRLHRDSWEFQLLQRWIESGAPGRPDDAPEFERLEVSPAEVVFHKPGETAQLKVVAVWSDGRREDVTCLSRFETKDDVVAEVSKDGLITAKAPGDTYVIVFYDNGIFSTQIIQPASQLTGSDYPAVPTPTEVDRLVVQKLSKLGVVPSEVCSDDEFLRRVSLDLTGTLPTPDEIRAFLEDTDPDKRSRKIDELLERPAYVTWWTTQLCDLTGSNAGYLGSTEMAQPVAEQWRDWLERRVRDNVGYDQIMRGILLGTSRRPGQPYEEFVREQSGYTRRQDPDDVAAPENSLPHFWFRSNLAQPDEKALAFGYVFLGVRLQCAQCHKHPYDQWSKQDFESFTKFFERIQTGVAPDAAVARELMRTQLAVPEKLNTAALRRQSYLRIAAEGNPIPWKEVFIAAANPARPEQQQARILGAHEVNLLDYADPRQPLADWLFASDNPYFARAFVNRIWAHYFNVGIVDPPDDLNLANPPSNKQLLDYLTREFIAQDYDMKWLHREITRSATYQRSWQPNSTNRSDTKNFSRAVIRRLPAEVAVDAFHQATAADRILKTAHTNVANRKIGQHPKSYQTRAIDFSLLIFGKPLRTTNCDCERQNDPTLLQALYRRNDGEMLELLDRTDGWLAEIAPRFQKAPPEEQDELLDEAIEEAYLRTLSRLPTDTERQECRTHVEQLANDGAAPTVEALRDLMWALLNTQEFITNH